MIIRFRRQRQQFRCVGGDSKVVISYTCNVNVCINANNLH